MSSSEQAGWEVIDSRFHDDSLGGDYRSATFEVCNKGAGSGVAYRHYRVTMSGPNSSGDDRMSVCALELYGRVVQSSGLRQQRAACELCLSLIGRLLATDATGISAGAGASMGVSTGVGASDGGGAGHIVAALYGHGGVALLLDTVHEYPALTCSIIASMLRSKAFGPDTFGACVCACVCACVYACVAAYLRACVRALVCALYRHTSF